MNQISRGRARQIAAWMSIAMFAAMCSGIVGVAKLIGGDIHGAVVLGGTALFLTACSVLTIIVLANVIHREHRAEVAKSKSAAAAPVTVVMP